MFFLSRPRILRTLSGCQTPSPVRVGMLHSLRALDIKSIFFIEFFSWSLDAILLKGIKTSKGTKNKSKKQA
jgi:hypothetical protein